MASIFQAASACYSVPLFQERCAPARISVAVIDPGCFSISYDYALCDALKRNGCDVTIDRSHDLHSEPFFAAWDRAASFGVRKHFYRLTHAARSRDAKTVVWKYVKAAEHVLNLGRLAGELQRKRPDIIHFQWLTIPAVETFYLANLKTIAPLVFTLHNTTLFQAGA